MKDLNAMRHQQPARHFQFFFIISVASHWWFSHQIRKSSHHFFSIGQHILLPNICAIVFSGEVVADIGKKGATASNKYFI